MTEDDRSSWDNPYAVPDELAERPEGPRPEADHRYAWAEGPGSSGSHRADAEFGAAGVQSRTAAQPMARPRRGLSGAAIAIIVILSVAGVLGTAALVGGVALLVFGVPLGSSALPDEGVDPGVIPGEVLDARGTVLPGVGTEDHPARLKDQQLRWKTEDGGTLTVVVTGVTWNADAAVAAASPSNPAPGVGNQYVLVDVTGTYRGSSHLDLGGSMTAYLQTTSDIYGADEQTAEPPHPLWRNGDLTNGQSASGQLLIEVPEDARQGSVLMVEVFFGEPLYVALP